MKLTFGGDIGLMPLFASLEIAQRNLLSENLDLGVPMGTEFIGESQDRRPGR
jgi:hypothetical protein